MSDGTADDPAIFVDLGTTNTRVWLARGQTILAGAQAHVGVRDTARDGSNQKLRETLRSLIDEVTRAGREKSGDAPFCVMAAGMITSSLGLHEVPHVTAPAGLRELAAATQRFEFPEISPLPILLVPGVRTGSLAEDPLHADIMRGEETLCIGLQSLHLIDPGGTVLNLGSHWKAIRIDSEGRVAGSVTSLSGEMIYAAQTGTILASALPSDRAQELDPRWIEAGMNQQRQSGLARALFCVRLLELADQTTPRQRMSFLVGAFIASDLDAMRKTRALAADAHVALVGSRALSAAWQMALKASGIRSTIIQEGDAEAALLAGLREILRAKNTLR